MTQAAEHKMVKCKAVRAFTHFVPGHGIVHMDPNDPSCAEATVPQHSIDGMVLNGFVEVIPDDDDEAADGEV